MRKAAQELSAETRIRAIRPAEREKPKGTVITVGEGRGFVVEHRGEHLVVTVATVCPGFLRGSASLTPKNTFTGTCSARSAPPRLLPASVCS